MANDMNLEVSEAMSREGAMLDWASMVVRNPSQLTDTHKEINEAVDKWARDLGQTGLDKDHELSALVKKTFTPETVSAPSELVSRMFDEGTIDEFDDIKVETDPLNTLQVYEAVGGGNVRRSFIEHEVLSPSWKTLQSEFSITMQDLRRGGYRTIAKYLDFVNEAFENKKINMIMTALDTAITSGAANYFDGSTVSLPTDTLADSLALYLHDMTTDGAPFLFALNKYVQKLSKLANAEGGAIEGLKSLYVGKGFIPVYGGVDMLGFSGQRKLADGSFLVPDKRIFGVAGKCGVVQTRGEARVNQETNINDESIHVKVSGYTFGYCVTDIAKIAKIVLQ